MEEQKATQLLVPATRQDILVLFNVIGALARKLTGEHPGVRWPIDAQGNWIGLASTPEAVNWIKAIPASSDQAASQEESPPKLS